MIARLLPGQIITGTRYRILAKIGQGAMGVVYAAEHVDLEKRVALKVLGARVARRPDALERFRNEARAASKIGSPYICDVTDFGELTDGRLFLVMEYLSGRALRTVLDNEGHVAPSRAIPILRQVAKALGAAHDKGIIHLDVKPDNIMVLEGRREMVKVVDFGVARLLGDRPQASDDQATETVVNGTPAYMAPERALGKGYDHRSDIYSLGIMSYEILTGSIPFDGEDIITTLRKQVHEAPEPLRSRAPEHRIPGPIEDMIFKLLAKDPAERPQSMTEVEGLLCEAQIASGMTTAWDDLELPHVDDAWRGRLAARMPHRWGRRAKLIVGGAVTMALLGAGAGVYFGIFRKNIVMVPVEVTRTREPPAVAEELMLAERAAQAQQYVVPANDSALFHIERAEEEAERLGIASRGAGTLRRAYASALTMVGDNLLRAGLPDLGVAMFKEALLFESGNLDLQRKAELTPRERQEYSERAGRRPGDRTAPRTSPDDRAKALAASLYVAARDGKTSEARAAFKALGPVDRGGVQAAHVADALRPIARTAWGDSPAEDARALYSVIAELDRSDVEARERSRHAMAAPPPAHLPAAKDKDKDKDKDREKDKDRPADAEPETKRNPSLSRAAADVGLTALNRGKLDEAQTAFQRAVRADPLNPVGVGGLAEVAFEQARYAEALDLGRRAWRLAPRTPRYLTIIGDSYFKLMRFDDARSAYGRALALAPRDDLLQSRMARVNARLGVAVTPVRSGR
jgi:tetratricopeptide (TPR) repeat protein/tRNA A-37 threonylcarbamoyl transferase component Bud32